MIGKTDLNSVQLGATQTNPGSVPLVMLHGWGRDLDDLLPLGKILARRRSIFLLDLPGFGLSAPPPVDWSTEDYAARVLQFMDDSGLKEVDVLGHSFGGRICLRLAAKNANRVRRCVLIDTHGLKRNRSLLSSAKIFWIPYLGKLVKFIDRVFRTNLREQYFVPRFGSADYKNAGALRGTLVKTVTEDQSNEIERITAPTLLLWGKNDRDTPLELAERLHKHLKHSELIVFEQHGHSPFEDVGAHLCASKIEPFLTRSEGP